MNELRAVSIPAGPKLNLGCGPVQPDGWINVDGSNRAWLASKVNWLDNLLVRLRIISKTEFNKQTRVLNLLNGLPFQNNSIAAIYAGELWEHLELEDARKLSAECFRVLAPGGVLRLVVPDGIEFWSKYLDIFRETMAVPRELRSGEPLQKHVAMYFRDICTRQIWLGSMGHVHKWQYDEVQLTEQMERVGFVEVERQSFQVSRIPDIRLVERSNFLIIEGVKPRE